MDSEHDRVVTLDWGVEPEAAVSGPLLLQDDSATFLTFNAMRRGADGRRAPAGTAIVEFEWCLCTRFGYPNDEALRGHPLYARGLGCYGIFEVQKSTWIAQLEAQNRIAFPAWGGWRHARHFIFTFHDSIFECIGDGLTVTVSQEPYAQILRRLVERTLRDEAPKGREE